MVCPVLSYLTILTAVITRFQNLGSFTWIIIRIRYYLTFWYMISFFLILCPDKYHGVILIPEGIVESIPEMYALLQVQSLFCLIFQFVFCDYHQFLKKSFRLQCFVCQKPCLLQFLSFFGFHFVDRLLGDAQTVLFWQVDYLDHSEVLFRNTRFISELFYTFVPLSLILSD